MVGRSDADNSDGSAIVGEELDPAARALSELQSSSRSTAGRLASNGIGSGGEAAKDSHRPVAIAEWMASWTRVVRSLVRERPSLVLVAGAVLVAVAVVAAALIVRAPTASSSHPPVVTIPAATTSTTRPGLVVQASGAVRSPGVHRLPTGSRVVDLLERAGGPTLDLDLDRVNLAAALVDGQRVWFPRLGEPAPSATATTGAAGAGGPTVIDINQATVDQLDTLPGIGPVLAAAIVSDRERRGRFADVEALGRVKGLTRSRIDAIRDLVTAG